MPVLVREGELIEAWERDPEAQPLHTLWVSRYSKVDMRFRFLKEAERRGEILLIVDGMGNWQSRLATCGTLIERLNEWQGVRAVVVTHSSAVDLSQLKAAQEKQKRGSA